MSSRKFNVEFVKNACVRFSYDNDFKIAKAMNSILEKEMKKKKFIVFGPPKHDSWTSAYEYLDETSDLYSTWKNLPYNDWHKIRRVIDIFTVCMSEGSDQTIVLTDEDVLVLENYLR